MLCQKIEDDRKSHFLVALNPIIIYEKLDRCIYLSEVWIDLTPS